MSAGDIPSTHRRGIPTTRPLVSSLLVCVLGLSCARASGDAVPITRLSDDEAVVRIDGRIDEAVWSSLPHHDNLVVISPDTLASPALETRTRMFYTNRGLYVGFWGEQDPASLVERLSSRDRFVIRDYVEIGLDTSGAGLYGYWFRIALGGALSDGTLLPERQLNDQWDGPWRGATGRTDDGWTAELFLPWSMMTMPGRDANRQVGFYVQRRVAHLGETWSWPGLPRSQPIFMSALETLTLDDVNPKQQFTFYPYASTTRDAVAGTTEANGGFDVFWRPTSNIQLTATFNPDFGNVESDDVVVNLTAFETFFPEKRAFFLEGSAIFITSLRAESRFGGGGGSGGDPTTLVNTRRIGGAPIRPDIPDGVTVPALELSQPSDLQAAVKVTGQQGRWRYGLLTAIEDDIRFDATRDNQDVRLRQEGRDFGVARLLYEDTSRGGRRSIGWIGTLVDHPATEATVHGIDAHYLSVNSRWLWDFQLLRSDVDDTVGQGGFLDVKYAPRQGLTHSLSLDYLDDQLDIGDLGFMRRNEVRGYRYRVEFESSDFERIRSRDLSVSLRQQYNSDGDLVRGSIFGRAFIVMPDNTSYRIGLSYDPPLFDDRNSDGNGSFRIEDRWEASLRWRSDRAKKLSATLQMEAKQEDLRGWTTEYSIDTSWQPSDRFSLRLDLEYGQRRGWLLHTDGREFTTYDAEVWQPRLEADYFLSATQQLRLAAQWAGFRAVADGNYLLPAGSRRLRRTVSDPAEPSRDFTISRLTMQMRYRWEIAPLSDLFIVYTRGANIPSAPGDDFGDLLSRAWTDKIVSTLVVKLRYRLGN